MLRYIACARDLDPRQNLHNRLPVPVIDRETLSISFYGAASGITYTVQTSTDLRNWITEGVTISDLSPEGIRRATVPRDTHQRFLRLVVD